MNLSIKIDEQENKFYAIVNGKECVLNFRRKDLNTLEFNRTFVPGELRGRGIAAELVEFGLNYAHEHSQKVIPTCGYVRAYIDDHPEWSTLVAR